MTGGGPADYGADAVTGVINIILKKDFEGVEVSGTAGWSDDGGADSEQVSLLAGTPFAADQGRFTFGASYNQQDPLFPLERDWSQEPNGYMLFGADPDSSSFMTTLDNYRFTDTAEGGTFYAINTDFTGCARYTVDPNLRVTQNDYWAGRRDRRMGARKVEACQTRQASTFHPSNGDGSALCRPTTVACPRNSMDTPPAPPGDSVEAASCAQAPHRPRRHAADWWGGEGGKSFRILGMGPSGWGSEAAPSLDG